MSQLLQEPSGSPVKPSKIASVPGLITSYTDPDQSFGPHSSPQVNLGPKSPVCSEAPSTLGALSPGKNGKKKARNRPPKHIRKGMTVQRKPDESEGQCLQQDNDSILATDAAGAAAVNDVAERPAAEKQLDDPSAPRAASAPISVPLQAQFEKVDSGMLKLEAFSSPKWLGTGFADRMEARIPSPTGPRCSGPMIDTASGQFTYFANSMW